jgi:phosphatidylglycerophosphatase C
VSEVVAAFDFDGTLSRKDCVAPFLRTIAGRFGLAGRLAARPRDVVAAAIARDRDRMKAAAARAAFRGRLRDDVEAVGRAFAQRVRARDLRADTPQRLAWHLREGHRVVLVSASFGAYLRPLGEAFGADAVLCTEAVVDADGRYTGELDGGNCRGPEKVRRLDAWLVTVGLRDATIWAYGDSPGDHALFARAHRHVDVRGLTLAPAPHNAS